MRIIYEEKCLCVWVCMYVHTHTFTVTLPVFSVAAFYLGHCYNLHWVRRRRSSSCSSQMKVKATLSVSGRWSYCPSQVKAHWCGLVLESQSHSVCGGCANSSGATTPDPLWQSATGYVCVYVTFKCNLCNSRRGRGSAASRANRLYSHSLQHATVQFTVGLLEHAASYA